MHNIKVSNCHHFCFSFGPGNCLKHRFMTSPKKIIFAAVFFFGLLNLTSNIFLWHQFLEQGKKGRKKFKNYFPRLKSAGESENHRFCAPICFAGCLVRQRLWGIQVSHTQCGKEGEATWKLSWKQTWLCCYTVEKKTMLTNWILYQSWNDRKKKLMHNINGTWERGVLCGWFGVHIYFG